MTGPESILELHVHLIDGSIERFAQPNPQAAGRILKGLDLANHFGKPHVTFETAQGIFIYPCAHVVRLDVLTEAELAFASIPRRAQVHEISCEEFEAQYHPEFDPALTRAQVGRAGEAFHGFIRIKLTSGETVVLEVNAQISAPLDQKMVFGSLFNVSTLVFPRSGGGYCLLNRANVLTFELLPGQPDVAPTAWPAERI